MKLRCFLLMLYSITCMLAPVSYARLPMPDTEFIPFTFTQAPLLPVIEALAARKNALLILPQAPADLDALKQQRMTYHPAVPLIPVTKAWELMQTFLEFSGFSMAHEKENVFVIVRNERIEGGAINREVLPLYAGVPPQSILGDERIRYIHYLRNLKVPTAFEKEQHPLTKMLKEFLSKDASLLFDPASNAIIMTDKASHIVALEHILTEFDNRGFKEAVMYLPLRNVPASDVVKVFDSLKIASGDGDRQGRNFIRTDARADSLTYFTQDTRIIADPLRNGIILMGRQNSVDKISEFIQDTIDVEPESAQSVLHYYDLKCLDAQKFAPQLAAVVSSLLPNLQATQTPVQSGQEHIFKGVAILPEVPIELSKQFTTEEITVQQKGFPEERGITAGATRGGNRLIVAAWQDDWKIIKKFIEQLDKPERQVILEMLIVEFTYDTRTLLASTTRSKTDACGDASGAQFLATFIRPVNAFLGNTPLRLAEDLLQTVGPDSVTNTIERGSLLISFNDPQTPGIFGLIQALDRVLKTKIRAYPHITVTNNQKGIFESEELKRSEGELVTTTNGTFTIPIEDVPAALKIVATPHIVSEDRLRLDIGFTLDEFRGLQRFDRVTRGLKTTATLASGQILAIGGIIRSDVVDAISQTPILGSIPILGNLFRRTDAQTIRTNITLFIIPTIIDPLGDHMARKTKNLVCLSQEDVVYPFNERDPIYRIFIREPEPQLADAYFRESSNLADFSLNTCAEVPKLIESSRTCRAPEKDFDILQLKERLAYQHESPLALAKHIKDQIAQK